MSAEPIHLADASASEEADERFQVLFRRYYGRVKGLAARRFPAFDSDDVAQETMVRVLLHAHRLDPQRDPWPYIAAIAVNVARDFGRARVPEVVLTEESYDREVAPAADEPVLAAERSAGVHDVLNCLAPGSRQVLALQAFDEMSVGEIAEFLGTNDNAVRQKLFRARNQFRRALASVPSGSFGIAAIPGLLVRLRRRVSPANLASGSGLSFTGAAALAVAVAGVVSYSVSPGGAYTETIAVPHTVTVEQVRATDGGALPETQAKVARAGTSATTVSSRTGSPSRPSSPERIDLPAPPVGHWRVDKPGNLFKPGQTDSSEVVIPTPVGEVRVGTVGENGPGNSVVCTAGDLRHVC